jgi:hypothetical protein
VRSAREVINGTRADATRSIELYAPVSVFGPELAGSGFAPVADDMSSLRVHQQYVQCSHISTPSSLSVVYTDTASDI